MKKETQQEMEHQGRDGEKRDDRVLASGEYSCAIAHCIWCCIPVVQQRRPFAKRKATGTSFAAAALREFATFSSQTQAARRLGNTRAVCRSCYIYPAVIQAYMEGSLVESLQQCRSRAVQNISSYLRLAALSVQSPLIF